MKTATLTEDTFATGIHGITGQEIDEGYLPAGTEVKDWKPTGKIEAFSGAVEIEFLAKQGKSWYIQRTWTNLPLSTGNYQPTQEEAYQYCG